MREPVTHNFLLKICATPPRPSTGLRLSIPHLPRTDNLLEQLQAVLVEHCGR